MEPAGRHFDLIVIGTGSAGGAGWETATRLGKRVAVFEREVLGGECPTFACVPSKALLHCAQVYRTVLGAHQFGIEVGSVSFNYQLIKERKDTVVSRTGAAQGEKPYRNAGVQLFRQEARFVSPGEVEAGGTRYSADRFLIATGSHTRTPKTEGLAEAGFMTFRDAIDLTRLPESLFILGGGPVGCEFTEIFSSFGVHVTIADHHKNLLAKEDPEVGGLIGELFSKRGVSVLTEASVTRVRRENGKKTLDFEQRGERKTVSVDEIMVATGKAPDLDLGLDKAGVNYHEKGVVVDDTLATTNPNIYAAGDCAGPYQFTHVATYQGQVAAHNAFSDHKLHVDYRAIPRCVFTSPEVATVGLTEHQAHEAGIDFRVGTAEIAWLGRSNTSEESDGFVKVIVDEDEMLVGAAIVASRAGEMVHELGLAISLGATAYQVASAIHAFPTFSEAVLEACARV